MGSEEIKPADAEQLDDAPEVEPAPDVDLTPDVEDGFAAAIIY